MLNFFSRGKSKTIAKDRLKFVLIHDRSTISPKVLEDLKNDIITVISKYIEIDIESLNLELSQSSKEVEVGKDITIIANIPLKIRNKGF
ncbi:MAG: cell division topological specificity factor MinE [Cetobacterium sp.]